MQEDLYQPMMTVREAMMIAADLKLGYDLAKAQKVEVASVCGISLASFE